MGYYEIWQRERFGNVIPANEPQEDEPQDLKTAAEIDYENEIENTKY